MLKLNGVEEHCSIIGVKKLKETSIQLWETELRQVLFCISCYLTKREFTNKKFNPKIITTELKL